MLLLSHFSRVWLCATPQTAAHQARPSLGFSRQEHWSGLPFPSPMHESEKWKWSRSVVSDSATPWTAAHQAPPSMGFSRQEYWSGVPLASLKACPEKFYWVKRKAAVHGTREWTETRSQKLWLWSGNQNPKGPLLSWQVRLMQRGDKDQFRDDAP